MTFFESNTNRMIAFLVGCIGSRLALAYLIVVVQPLYLKVISVIMAAIAIGFAVIFVGGFRKVGIETGGKAIWWNYLRPFHSITYALASYFAWIGNRKYAMYILLVDIVVGLISYVVHRR